MKYILLFFIAVSSQAANYTYANWTSAVGSSGSTPGIVTGTLNAPGGTVTVTYTGDVASPTQVNNVGNDYYSSWQSVYTNGTVSNSPTNVGLIALQQAAAFTNTITFGSAVLNPIIDIVSLGQGGAGVSYIFDSPFSILSDGPAWFGGCTGCLTQSGNTLTGNEGDGVLQFSGSFNSISFTTRGGEYWNGITVGIADVDAGSSTPEPSTWSLLAVAGLALSFGVRQAKRKALAA